MATITTDDIKALEDHFMTKDDCAAVHKAMDKQLVDLTLAYTETRTQFKMLMGILCFIGTTVLGILIKMFIGG